MVLEVIQEIIDVVATCQTNQIVISGDLNELSISFPYEFLQVTVEFENNIIASVLTRFIDSDLLFIDMPTTVQLKTANEVKIYLDRIILEFNRIAKVRYV